MRTSAAFVLSFGLAALASSPAVFAVDGKTVTSSEAPVTKTPEAETFISKHQLAVGGRTVDYTATAGTVLMKDDAGKPIALFGSTAYVENGTEPAKRPILFAYIGAPDRPRSGCTWASSARSAS